MSEYEVYNTFASRILAESSHPPRLQISDSMSLSRSLLHSLAFYMTARALTPDGPDFNEAQKVWKKFWNNSAHFRPTDWRVVQHLRRLIDIDPSIERDKNTKTYLDLSQRIFGETRNIIAHVGVSDQSTNDDAHALRSMIKAGLHLINRLEQDVLAFADQLDAIRLRANLESGLPILRDVYTPPGYPLPRLEWWQWSTESLRRDEKIVQSRNSLVDMIFPGSYGIDLSTRPINNLPTFNATDHVAHPTLQQELARFVNATTEYHLAVEGPGGAGKTAGVLAFCHQILGRDNASVKQQPSAILFYSGKKSLFESEILYDIENPALTIAEILRTDLIGLMDRGLLRQGKGQKVIIVLDNCETIPAQQIKEVWDITEELNGENGHGIVVKVIFTSRRDLGCKRIKLGQLPPQEQCKLINLLLEERGFIPKPRDRGRLHRAVPTTWPLILREAILGADTFNEVLPRINRFVSGGQEQYVRFMVDSAWEQLSESQRALLTLLTGCCLSISGPVSSNQLVHAIQMMNSIRLSEKLTILSIDDLRHVSRCHHGLVSIMTQQNGVEEWFVEQPVQEFIADQSPVEKAQVAQALAMWASVSVKSRMVLEHRRTQLAHLLSTSNQTVQPGSSFPNTSDGHNDLQSEVVHIAKECTGEADLDRQEKQIQLLLQTNNLSASWTSWASFHLAIMKLRRLAFNPRLTPELRVLLEQGWTKLRRLGNDNDAFVASCRVDWVDTMLHLIRSHSELTWASKYDPLVSSEDGAYIEIPSAVLSDVQLTLVDHTRATIRSLEDQCIKGIAYAQSLEKTDELMHWRTIWDAVQRVRSDLRMLLLLN